MSNSDAKKFHDVLHPSKVAANASGKPVIVSNRPILKDPMVHDDASQAIDLRSKFGPKIAPRFEESSIKTEEVNNVDDQVTEEDASVRQEEVADNATVPKPEAAIAGRSQDSNNPVGSIDTHLQELNNLVENQTYFVHIGKPRRTRRLFLLMVPFIIIISAALGYTVYMIFQN